MGAKTMSLEEANRIAQKRIDELEQELAEYKNPLREKEWMKVPMEVWDALKQELAEHKRESEILEGACDYWQEAALEARGILRAIASDSPHRHVKVHIEEFLVKYQGDTDDERAS